MRVFTIILCMLMAIAMLACEAKAIDLGGGLSTDGFITSGKVWDAEQDNKEITLRTKEGSWYVIGEAGLKYSFARAFLGYQKFTETVDAKTAGLDLFPFNMKGTSLGIRTAYTYLKMPGVQTQDLIYTGAIIKW